MNVSDTRPCRDVCGAYSIRPYTDAPKPGEDCAKNRFEARNPARITPKTDLEPKMTLGLRQKRNLSLRRPSFWAKNRFGAQNDPRITPKTDLKPKMILGLGQKQDLGLGRPSFHTSTHKHLNE